MHLYYQLGLNKKASALDSVTPAKNNLPILNYLHMTVLNMEILH